ncbi:hypothetical protein Tco_0438134 [Tanacetum coccineum]
MAYALPVRRMWEWDWKLSVLTVLRRGKFVVCRRVVGVGVGVLVGVVTEGMWNYGTGPVPSYHPLRLRKSLTSNLEGVRQDRNKAANNGTWFIKNSELDTFL